MKLQSTAIGAAILTGGQSRRMGQDKALLEWETGQLLIDRAIATLNGLSLTSEIHVVGDREPYHDRGATVIADEHPGVGPLGGIATALRHCGTERVLVVAIDMPCLSIELLDAMTEHRFDGDALIPRVDGYQPLHAIYRRTCLRAIERQLESGELRVADVFEHIDVTFLDRDWIRRFDPDGRSFVNVNTPQDLQRVRAAAVSKKDPGL